MGGGRGPCSSKEKEDPVSDFEGEFSGLGGGAGEAHGSHGGEEGTLVRPAWSRTAAAAAGHSVSGGSPSPHAEVVMGVASGGAWDRVVTGSDDGTCALVEWGTGAVVRRWRGHTKGVTAVSSGRARDGEEGAAGVVASASRDGTVRLWGEGSDEAAGVLEAHELTATAVALSPPGGGTGLLCATGGRDARVTVWDVGRRERTQAVKMPLNMVTGLCWCPETEGLLAQSGEDVVSPVRLWDTRRGLGPGAVEVLKGYKDFPKCIDVSGCGTYVLTGSNGFQGSGCEVWVWDRRSARAPLSVMRGHTEAVLCCTFARGSSAGARAGALTGMGGTAGGLVAVTGSKDGSVRVWDVDACATLCVLDNGLRGPAQSLACLGSKDDAEGARLALGSFDGSVHVFELGRVVSSDGVIPDMRCVLDAQV